MNNRVFRVLWMLFACWAAQLHAAGPEWIWFSKTRAAEVRYFRKSFTVNSKPAQAQLVATGDDAIEVFINGKLVLKNSEWAAPAKADVAETLVAGENIIALRGRNGDASSAGLLVKLDITTAKGINTIVTDGTWKAAANEENGWNTAAFSDAKWASAKSLGAEGVGPWGSVLGGAKAKRVRGATPPEALYTLPGFKVDLIHSAAANEGSWVAMTRDDKNRLIVSPQWARDDENMPAAQRGLLRLTLDDKGQVMKREFIAKPLYDAQGLLFVNGAIYAVVNKYSTKFESGLYRIQDRGNDQFDDIQLMKKFPGGGEHGPHSVVLAPDGKSLFVVCGNHTKLAEGIDPASPHRNFEEDHLLPRQWDGNGHATGIMAPGGHVYHTDLEAKKWELFCGGFRNAYDLAFNGDGELFTFDSDMEWDWGMPWYRPTRVNHCVSGGEYGWRSGTGKWPDYYADSLGAIDIGLGSPTGIQFGTGAKFPAKYQRALFILDWTYGRLMAVHLTANGASYKGAYENFVCPLGLVKKEAEKRPLNLTDITIGADGAMYFTVGGRNIQSGLYRVTYTGTEPTAQTSIASTSGGDARALRHQLEAFHGKQDAKAVDFAWPHLDSSDRFIRYAARIAIESQPVASWKQRALSETKTNAALTALLALARVGGKDAQTEIFNAVKRFPTASLSEEQALTKLRLVAVSMARNGRPNPDLVALAKEKLSPLYPNANLRYNHELMQLLTYLDGTNVVAKTLQLMAAAPNEEEEVFYLFHLRNAKTWTLDQRKEYFRYFAKDRSKMPHRTEVLRWFDEAGRPYSDGASYANFIKNFYTEAVSLMDTNQKAAIEKLLVAVAPTGSNRKKTSAFPAAAQRAFVKDWKIADIEPLLDQVSKGRDFRNGKQAFVDAQCLLCHKLGDEGGGVGPDLTAVASRFSRRDILESILEPSKVVSEQFLNTTVETKDGEEFSGRLVDESPEKLVLQPNPLQPQLVEVKVSNIKTRGFSKLSPMPDGLATVLSKEDLLDLIAFLESGGSQKHASFKK